MYGRLEAVIPTKDHPVEQTPDFVAASYSFVWPPRTPETNDEYPCMARQAKDLVTPQSALSFTLNHDRIAVKRVYPHTQISAQDPWHMPAQYALCC